jgi:hypothetical protein
MTWLKLDDSILEHPKFAALSDPGWSLWVRALAWAGKYRTDGALPRNAVARLGTRAAIRELVEARLWDPRPGGAYQILDFLDYNLVAHGRAARRAAGHKGAAARWGDTAAPDDAPPPAAGGRLARDTGAGDPAPDDAMANRIDPDGKSHRKPHAKNAGGDGKPHPPVFPYSRIPERPDQKLRTGTAETMTPAGAFFADLRRRLEPGDPE